MIKTTAMTSCRRSVHRALSVVLLLTLLGQGPGMHCVVLQLSPAHTTMTTPGASCPLMLASKDSATPPSHHCDMQQQRQHRSCELRCACHTGAPISTWDGSVVRYLLPQATTTTPTSLAASLWIPSFLNVHDVVVFPLDPPPRLSPFVSA